jgi:3-phosphoshikimate 1-carboxyvinyltransferase
LQLFIAGRNLAGEMSEERINPVDRPFSASVTPPGSKSLTNRALVLAALAKGRSTLTNVLVADDTRVMIDCLKKLGFSLDVDGSGTRVTVDGGGGRIPLSSAELFCGNSGTTIRFVAAMCGLGRGEYVLDGTARMRERPIGELMELLRQLGVRSRATMKPECPPIVVQADGVAGGMVQIGSAHSSQFLSAALMIGPMARHEVTVDLIDRQTSWPYVAMTMQYMDAFDVTPELIRDPVTGEPKRIIVPKGVYRGREMAIEPDASGATYFLAAAAMHPGAKVTIEGLGRASLQGDVAFADVLRKMGARVKMQSHSISVTGTEDFEGIDVDMSEMPDAAMTLAVAALFASGTTTIRGLHTLRVKETDRLTALSTELSRLGAHTKIEEDSLIIEPPARIRPAEIETYDDHRMAMSFSLAATKAAGVVIKDAQCVSKTYPGFFTDLKGALARIAT